MERLREEPALDGYHLLPTVRGDLLEKLGRLEEARAEFERAARLTANARQRAALLDRAASCAAPRADPTYDVEPGRTTFGQVHEQYTMVVRNATSRALPRM